MLSKTMPSFKRRLVNLVFLPLVILSIFSVAITTLGYQIKPTFKVDMGLPADRHYLTDGFYAIEKYQDFTYRWTRGYMEIRLNGLGQQNYKLKVTMVANAQDARPTKPVKVEVRGALVALFDVGTTLNTYETTVSKDLISRLKGDLKLIISTPTFNPPGERRDLGVVMTGVEVEPAPDGFVLPSLLQILIASASVLGIYTLVVLNGLKSRVGLVAGAVAVLGLMVLYVTIRPMQSLYASWLLLAIWLAVAVFLVMRPLITKLYQSGGLDTFKPGIGQARVLFLLATFFLLVSWAGLLFPNSTPNDFGFHLNRYRMVQQGNLFFDDYVISGVGRSFYPPAMYVLLWPLGFLFGDGYHLLRLVTPLFSVVLMFAVYYLVARYFSTYRYAAICAASLVILIPINTLVIWWAHQTNHFGLSILFLSWVFLQENFERLGDWRVWLFSTLLIFTVILAHPAILFLGSSFFMALLLVCGGLWLIRRQVKTQSFIAYIVALVAAGGLAFVLYYSHFLSTFGQATGGNAPASGISETLQGAGDLSGIWSMARLTFIIGFLGDYALLPLLLAFVGLVLLLNKKTAMLSALKPERYTRLKWGILAWIALGVGGILITFVTSLSLRPILFLWPVVALIGGLALGRFLENPQRWRLLLTMLFLTFLGILSVYYWYTAHFLDLAPPHVF
jgi:hypothetical protein